jgi:2'-5' RNA ligase
MKKMEEKIRTFIAINLDPQTKAYLKGIQDILLSTDVSVKWVEIENLHLTLKFLGGVERERLEEVKKTTFDLLKDIECFKIVLGGIGAFPNSKRPKVVWIGVEEGINTLKDIFERLDKGLRRLGFSAEEKGFTPHLTLGRVRSFHNIERLSKALLQVRTEPKVVDVSTIDIMKSQLTPKGPIYSVLGQIQLKSSKR